MNQLSNIIQKTFCHPLSIGTGFAHWLQTNKKYQKWKKDREKLA
jgi:hypothetical protein